MRMAFETFYRSSLSFRGRIFVLCFFVFLLLWGHTSFSAKKMKLVYAGFIIFTMMLSLCFTCEKLQWRGHAILCCPNGTAFKADKGLVWTEQKPSMCLGAEKKKESKALETIMLLLLVLFLACCCCQMFYGIVWCEVLRCYW